MWGDIITEKQYTIGEFAALNKITARMLRHYDKIGLLRPFTILENGYRAYTSTQIHIVSKIRLYQSCQFSLTEIMDLLSSDADTVQQAAKCKIEQLGVQEKSEQLARKRLAQLAKIEAKSFENHYDMSFTDQSEQVLFCCVEAITEVDIENAIDKLYAALDVCACTPNGHLLLLSKLEEGSAYRVAVPVYMNIVCAGYECITRKAGWYLSTFHHGDYCSIGMAYDELIRYAAEKEYQVKPPFVERYFLDAGNTTSPAHYVTQILIELIA